MNMVDIQASNKNNKTITTTCSYDCGGRCLLKVHVRDNRVIDIRSGNAEGLNIKACPRGLAQKEVLYSPARLKTPLRRNGERGCGDFEPISWDKALDLISKKLSGVINKYGTPSIFFAAGSGCESSLNDVGKVSARFFGMLGRCTTVWGGASLEAALQSSLATFGTRYTGSTRDNILYSKYIILWGWNPRDTRFGSDTYYYLKKARDSGVGIICIDPRENRTARSLAHKWIPIRPGTDAAMLIAMAYVMIDEKIYDRDFIEKYTYGFNHFYDYVVGRDDGVPKSPGWAEGICGVPAGTIEDIARDYARIKPAALMTGWAPGRSAYGEQFQRAASVLAAMTGNIGIRGGFVSGGTDIIRLGRMEKKIPVPGTGHNLVHNTELYDALLSGTKKDYPADCRLLYITGHNLLNQYLNLNKGIEAFKKQDFIVVHEMFLTPTARYADIVLPVTHYLERDDIGLPWIGGPFTIFMNRAVRPDHGAKSDLEIFTGISERMGLKGFNGYSDREWMKKILSDTPGFPGLEDLEKTAVHICENDGSSTVAFSDQIKDPSKTPFPTPSGKIEIFSSRFYDMKDPLVPPIPEYIPAWEGPDDDRIKVHPLQLVTTHARLRINSQLDNIEGIKSGRDDRIWINREDAAARGISNGDRVLVYNDRGKIRVKAKVTDGIMKGVASIDQGKWYRPDNNGVDDGGNANVLTLDRMSPTGAFTSNTCLVQIEKE